MKRSVKVAAIIWLIGIFIISFYGLFKFKGTLKSLEQRNNEIENLLD